MIWAEHVHRTTRPVDRSSPDTRSFMSMPPFFNATFDSVEKRWKAIQLGDIVRDKGYYQAAFHARLAHKLKDLGYGIEKDGNSFSLPGIEGPRSRNSPAGLPSSIAEAERLGIDDASRQRQARPPDAREEKRSAGIHGRNLRAEWDTRLTPEERLAIRTASSGWKKGDAAITPEQAKEYALEHSFQNASAVSEKRLQAEALDLCRGLDYARSCCRYRTASGSHRGNARRPVDSRPRRPSCTMKWRCCNSRRTGSGNSGRLYPRSHANGNKPTEF